MAPRPKGLGYGYHRTLKFRGARQPVALKCSDCGRIFEANDPQFEYGNQKVSLCKKDFMRRLDE